MLYSSVYASLGMSAVSARSPTACSVCLETCTRGPRVSRVCRRRAAYILPREKAQTFPRGCWKRSGARSTSLLALAPLPHTLPHTIQSQPPHHTAYTFRVCCTAVTEEYSTASHRLPGNPSAVSGRPAFIEEPLNILRVRSPCASNPRAVASTAACSKARSIRPVH